MSIQITVFDINEQPMQNHPVDLLQNGQVIASATTDSQGVATFSTAFSNAPNLALRSQLNKP